MRGTHTDHSRPIATFGVLVLSDEQPVVVVFLRESTYDSDAALDTGGGNTMGADNQTIGSDWRGWGVRAGLVSMMAATGMVLAGQTAQATTTVTEPPRTQTNGDGEGLPLDLVRLADGNSGATCAVAYLGTQLDSTSVDAEVVLPDDIAVLNSDRALKRDITLVQWRR